MKDFKHFLITRFNIVQEWYGTTAKSGKPTQTDEWLADRFRLFEAYCFPSVKNQSCTDFTWFVLFNSETPEFYKQKIAHYQAEFPNLMPLYLEPYGNEKELARVNICEIMGGGVNNINYIITSRLDNDDALHRDFIQVVQDNFVKQDNLFLNLLWGYQFDIKTQRLMKMYYESNHYVSRISKIKDNNSFELVLCNHSYLEKEGRVYNIDNTYPLWIEITHGWNVGNQKMGAKPEYDKKFKDNFNVNAEYDYFHYLLNIVSYLVHLYSISYFFRKIKNLKRKIVNKLLKK